MFVELIEFLRCPRDHEETQLVASASRTAARQILEGVLGCSTCGAEFAIQQGVVHFDNPPVFTVFELPDAEVATQLGAFLELTDSRGFALLCGRWCVHAALLQQMTDTPLVLVNPSFAVSTKAIGGAIRGDVVPFAEASARAMAVDQTVSPRIVASGVRSVKPGGRVLGSVTLAVPPGVTELVRDDRVWVGEKTAATNAAPRPISIKTRG